MKFKEIIIPIEDVFNLKGINNVSDSGQHSIMNFLITQATIILNQFIKKNLYTTF